ncbi:MAG: hypothetical protein GXO90_06640 [FCB group bacterium]|nr:hypothetical protein [FCB group bacterium]
MIPAFRILSVLLVPGALVFNGCMGPGMMMSTRISPEQTSVKAPPEPHLETKKLLDSVVNQMPGKLDSIRSLAVIQITGNSGESVDDWMIPYLENQMISTTDYAVVDRSLIVKIMDENSLNLNGLTRSSEEWKGGELLPADGLVTGVFTRSPSGMELILKIISTRTGAIVWSASASSP